MRNTVVDRGFRMRQFSRTVLVGFALVAFGFAGTAGAQDSVITRGDAIGNSPVVDLADALSTIHAYTDTSVILEGSVRRVCQVKGCWMELVQEGASRGLRVTFKDYGFFVPTDSDGQAARIEGVFETNVFSKRQADHLIEEGVELTRNPDGTATEVSFVAAAVELRPAGN